MNQSVLSDCEVKLPAGGVRHSHYLHQSKTKWTFFPSVPQPGLDHSTHFLHNNLAGYFHLVCIYACDTRIFQQLGACLEFQTHLGGFFISSLWGDLSHDSAMGAPQGLDWAVMIPEKRVSWQCGEGSRKFCHGHATLCTEQTLKNCCGGWHSTPL